MYWSNGTDGWGAGAWIAMAVMMLLFWGLIAAIVVYVIRSSRQPMQPPTTEPRSGDHALHILDERYARGEIDTDEYSQRRELLARR